jgi:polyisoprenoid-binding protein YceI
MILPDAVGTQADINFSQRGAAVLAASQGASDMTNRRRRIIAIIIGAIVLAGGMAGAVYGIGYLFFREPAPPAVGTVDVASTAPTGSATSSSGGPSASGDEITGVVDTSIGSFADFTSSFVGYRVQEELAGIGGQTAVGRTPDVSGTLTLVGTTLTSTEVTADLTTLVSDDDRRDNQLREQAIQTDTYPTATFVLTEPIELPDGAADGDEVTVTASGELTLHGVTQPVEVPIMAQLVDDAVVITGSIDIAFAGYEIEKPTSMIVLSVDDHGVMEFQLFFTQP